MKDPNKVKAGRISRKKGKLFENKVRDHLTKQGWIVIRWDKNVEDGKLVNAKGKFNPFTKRVMNMSAGFPDFFCMKNVGKTEMGIIIEYKLVECKINGKLDKEEKVKAEWIKRNLRIPVIIARPGAKRGDIIYQELNTQEEK
jgi:hypothetical protein